MRLTDDARDFGELGRRPAAGGRSVVDHDPVVGGVDDGLALRAGERGELRGRPAPELKLFAHSIGSKVHLILHADIERPEVVEHGRRDAHRAEIERTSGENLRRNRIDRRIVVAEIDDAGDRACGQAEIVEDGRRRGGQPEIEREAAEQLRRDRVGIDRRRDR